MRSQGLVVGQEGHQILETGHGNDRNTVIALYFLDGGQVTLAAFLAVEGNQDAGRRGARGTDQFNGFAHGGAGRDDVIDNQDAAGQRGANDIAAFAMVFRFLAVEGKRVVLAVTGQGDGDGCHQRNALIGWAKQHLEAETAGLGSFRVEFGEPTQRIAVVEQAGVEEIGRQAACLGFEFAEAEHVAADGKFDEVLTKIHVQSKYRGRLKTTQAQMLRIISLNLNGIRSAWNKNVAPWLAAQSADVVCFQELKAQLPNLSEAMLKPEGMHAFYHCAEKKGYSGVGIWSRAEPDRVIEGFDGGEFDAEGRYLRADFGDLSVISLYLPSGSSSPERQEAKFRFLDVFLPHMAALRAEGREIVLCGDWNIAHQNIDLKNWKGNQKNSGFLPEERAWLSRLFDEQGWVDVYRALYPTAGEEAYTWWSNRGQAWAKNVGWRIDYQIATPGIAATAQAASVYKDARFSDHAPLIIDYAR